LILAVAVLTAFPLMTCDSLDNIAIGQSAQSTVPMRTVLDQVLGNLSFAGFEGFDLTQAQEFENQGYGRDQIDSVRVESLSLTIDDPEDADFDFIMSIAFFAEAEGLPRVRIAFLDTVPRGASVLDLSIEDQDLLDYVVAPSMTITTEVTGTAPEQETTLTGRVDFDVDINVSGALGC